MRNALVIALALLGCGGKSTTHQAPADPARADLDAFCAPDAAAKTSSLTELGPFVEPKMHEGGELKKLLLQLKSGSLTIDQFKLGVEKLMQDAHVTSCLTLDKLFAPKPT